MIERIEIEKCTGCGICDAVCPADVIHMEPVPVASEVSGLRQSKLLPVIKFREHCITCFSCEIFCPERIVDVQLFRTPIPTPICAVTLPEGRPHRRKARFAVSGD